MVYYVQHRPTSHVSGSWSSRLLIHDDEEEQEPELLRLSRCDCSTSDNHLYGHLICLTCEWKLVILNFPVEILWWLLAAAPWSKVVYFTGEVSMQSPCSVFGCLFRLCILYFFLKAAVWDWCFCDSILAHLLSLCDSLFVTVRHRTLEWCWVTIHLKPRYGITATL